MRSSVATHFRAYSALRHNLRCLPDNQKTDCGCNQKTRSWEWMDRMSADLRLALRSLRRAPVFTAVATLSLALGIGAATTLFSVVDAMDFRPLPYPNADRLVVFDSPTRGPGLHEVATLDTLDRWSGCAKSCDGLALVNSGGSGGLVLVREDGREMLDVGAASP